MAYISIYRKYRPTSWSSVVEQDHIVKILKNQIKNDMVSHAYLFTGTRGTGKTSIAKLFAKAVNCETPIDGDACGKCISCQSMQDATSLDVIEMDAASNNGVDEIRNIKEEIKYRPTVCKYKIYIIDEVHMLSPGAFNALLKTLEEPPSHVIFILATTEMHKLPQTILSRCMCFEFRLVSNRGLSMRIKQIFDDMRITYEESAIQAIAEAGEGSVRDCLSVADICVSYCDGHITYADVLSLLGAANPNTIATLLDAIFNRRERVILSLLSELAALGKSPLILAKDLASMARDLFFLKVTNGDSNAVFLPHEIINKLMAIPSYDEFTCRNIIDELSMVEGRMKYSNMPQILLETALIKLTTPMQTPAVHYATPTPTASHAKSSDDEHIPIAEPPPVQAYDLVDIEAGGIGFPVEEAIGLVINDYTSRKELYKSRLIGDIDKRCIKLVDNVITFNIIEPSAYKDIIAKKCDEDILRVLKGLYGIEHCEFKQSVADSAMQSDIEQIKTITSKDILTIKRSK